MSVGDPPIPVYIHSGSIPPTSMAGEVYYDTSHNRLFTSNGCGGWSESYIPPSPNGMMEVESIIKEIGYQKAARRLVVGREFEAMEEAALENEIIHKLLDRVRVAMRMVTV